MKKTLLILVLAPLFFMSCGDDDGATPAHEVGEWSLDSYVLQNFPIGFESNEGLLLTVDQITFGGLAVESYDLVINNDGTYERSIGVTGPDVDDQGTWTLDGDELELQPEDGDEEEFQVEKNEEDDLWLTERGSITAAFIPDIYFDTVTQSYIDFLNTLNQTQLDSVDAALSQTIVLDLVYIFERD